MKFIRQILAVVALLTVAIKGILSFLSWFEKQEEVSAVWSDEEEFEEVI